MRFSSQQCSRQLLESDASLTDAMALANLRLFKPEFLFFADVQSSLPNVCGLDVLQSFAKHAPVCMQDLISDTGRSNFDDMSW